MIAQTGVLIYGTFSIIGTFFQVHSTHLLHNLQYIFSFALIVNRLKTAPFRAGLRIRMFWSDYRTKVICEFYWVGSSSPRGSNPDPGQLHPDPRPWFLDFNVHGTYIRYGN